MSGKLIFKMEMFKFLRDKSYLITAGVLAVLNIIIVSVAMNSDTLYYDNSYTAIFAMMAVFMIVIYGNMIFVFIYPFHILSMDYKNNVMAMMIASGVNRTKLFFAKLGAVVVSTIVLSLITSLIPILMFIFRWGKEFELKELFEGLSQAFSVFDGQGILVILSLVLAYFNALIMISAATILMKGRNLAVLVWFGLGIVWAIVIAIFNSIFSNGEASVLLAIVDNILGICVFGFISLKTLQKQSL